MVFSGGPSSRSPSGSENPAIRSKNQRPEHGPQILGLFFTRTLTKRTSNSFPNRRLLTTMLCCTVLHCILPYQQLIETATWQPSSRIGLLLRGFRSARVAPGATSPLSRAALHLTYPYSCTMLLFWVPCFWGWESRTIKLGTLNQGYGMSQQVGT